MALNNQKNKRKRNLKSNPAFAAPYGKDKPLSYWAVHAENCDGSKPDYLAIGHTGEEARKHADWLHLNRTVMNVSIEYPAYTGEKTAPTEQDVAVGHALAEVLDNRTVKPSAKMDINLWLDSKEWP